MNELDFHPILNTTITFFLVFICIDRVAAEEYGSTLESRDFDMGYGNRITPMAIKFLPIAVVSFCSVSSRYRLQQVILNSRIALKM